METKPGYLTTEFWSMIFVVAGACLAITGVWNWVSNWHGGILAVIVVAAYNYSRGQAKNGVGFDPAAYEAWQNRKSIVKGTSGD